MTNYERKKLDKRDHAGMSAGAKIVKRAAAIGFAFVAAAKFLKSIAEQAKKS